MASCSRPPTELTLEAIGRWQRERRSAWESRSRTFINFNPHKLNRLNDELIRELYRSLVRESLIDDFVAWAAEDNVTFRSVAEDLLNRSSTDEFSTLVHIAKVWVKDHAEAPSAPSPANPEVAPPAASRTPSAARPEVGPPAGTEAPSTSGSGAPAKADHDAPSTGVSTVLPREDSLCDLYQSMEEGMLVASRKMDLKYLNHVLQFCHNHKYLGGSLMLWESLRSVQDRRGYSPLHIAVIMGFDEVVEMLVLGKHSSTRRPIVMAKNSSVEREGGRKKSEKQDGGTGKSSKAELIIEPNLSGKEKVEGGMESCGEQQGGTENCRDQHGGIEHCEERQGKTETTGQRDEESKKSGRGQGESEFFNVDVFIHARSFNFDALHARTREGWTPLHLAIVATGYDDFVANSTSDGNALKGATKPEGAKSDGKAFEGATLPGGAKSIGKAQATLNTLISMYEEVRKPVKETWDFVDNLWMTPLHYAVLANRLEAVKKLLNWELYHKHVNAGDNHRKTPLHMAICHFNFSSSGKSSQYLKPGKRFGFLMKSYARPGIDLIKTLAESPQVNVHAVDCCLYTPLHWAVHCGCTEVVRYLVSLKDSKRARATMKDIKGRTIMQMAIEATAKQENSKQSGEQEWDSYQGDNSEGSEMEKHAAVRGDFEDIQTVLLECEEVNKDIERLYRDRQVYVDATNAMLVGAALVASVTFQGWLQPPEADNSKLSHRWVWIFWWTNSVSFYSAVASVTAGAAAALPSGRKVFIGRSVEDLRLWLSLTALLLMISALHVLIAFAGSGFAALTLSVPNLDTSMIITTSLGMPVCFIIIAVVFFRVWRLLLDRMTLTARAFQLVKAYIVHPVAHWWRRRCRVSSLPVIPETLASSSWNIHRQTELDEVLDRVKFVKWKLSDDGDRSNVQKQDLHQLDVLKYVYEEVRKELNQQSRVTHLQKKSSCCFGLMARGIHHWMIDCPIDTCREYSIEIDRRRWLTLAGRVDILHNQHYSLDNSQTCKWEEWFGMCLTMRRIEESLGRDWIMSPHFQRDWYRFSYHEIKFLGISGLSHADIEKELDWLKLKVKWWEQELKWREREGERWWEKERWLVRCSGWRERKRDMAERWARTDREDKVKIWRSLAAQNGRKVGELWARAVSVAVGIKKWEEFGRIWEMELQLWERVWAKVWTSWDGVWDKWREYSCTFPRGDMNELDELTKVMFGMEKRELGMIMEKMELVEIMSKEARDKGFAHPSLLEILSLLERWHVEEKYIFYAAAASD